MHRSSRLALQPLTPSLVLILGLIVAACGGGASAAPSSSNGPGNSTNPGSSAAASEPVSSNEPGESLDAGTGSEAFGAATTALDALDSYAFRVEIKSSSSSSGSTTDSHTILSGIVVNRPEAQSSLEQAELDKDGNVTSESSIVIIGDTAWTRDGGEDGTWTEIPASAAQAFILSMSAFRPEQMFGVYFLGIGDSFHPIGTETKNGVPATHYQGDESVGTLLGAIAGVQGSWSSDVWIATDGGYLVHSEAGAQASAAGDSGGFMILVDITDPNSAGPIEPPI